MEEPVVELKNVTYRHGMITRLNDISFSIKRGENTTIFGPEGSGITSLFDVIVKGVSDYEGDVFYEGKSIKNLNYIELLNHKKGIGYVHGDYGLISNMSVEQNIALPLEYHSQLSTEEIKDKVGKIVYELNLDHCRKLRPIDLTRSEILKTAFGRAIALDPDLLYMEHAFEDQCNLNIKSLIDVIIERTKSHEKALITITYEPENFVDISDSFIMFFNGRIVFSGNREDFLTSDNPYLVQYKNNSIEGPMIIL